MTSPDIIVARVNGYAITFHEARAVWACVSREPTASVRAIARATGACVSRTAATLEYLAGIGFITTPRRRGAHRARAAIFKLGEVTT
jgi:predicted transcriptional regulator